MSIINQMLRDLEARRAGNDHVVMPGSLETSSGLRRMHPAWLVVAVLIGLIIGVAVWMWLSNIQASKPLAQSAVVAEPIPQVVSVESPVQDVIATGPVNTEGGVSSAAKEENSLQVSDGLASGREARETVSTASAPIIKPVLATPKPIEVEPKPSVPVAAEVASLAVASPATVTQALPPTSTPIPAASQDAVRIDKQVKPLTPLQRAETDYRQATVYVQQGRTQEATTLLGQALQSDPAHVAARQTLIALLLQSGRRDDAVRRAQEGLQIDSRQLGMAMILARLQVDKGEQVAAINTLQKTLPHVLDRPDYQAFLAALLQREGRHKEAVAQYLAAVRLAPQNGLWWMGLGISQEADGHAAEARDAFARARDTNMLTPELQAFVEQKIKQLR